ncbi:MAG: CBS domain-containing protein [Fidelibacterota bacterium]|jgi:CBS domain-containing protein|tara:strand:- start:1576 stop:1989 length:414 start_codon:yes stop_codon:yes gene_type:complete
MDKNYSINDFMAKKLITFNPETPIEIAIESFLKNKISGAPVVNKNGDLVGVLSEKDCMRTLLESTYYNYLGGYVKEYMSQKVEYVSIHDTLLSVADRFMNSRFRRYPVMNSKKLVGQISRRDVLRAIVKLSKEKKIK